MTPALFSSDDILMKRVRKDYPEVAIYAVINDDEDPDLLKVTKIMAGSGRNAALVAIVIPFEDLDISNFTKVI